MSFNHEIVSVVQDHLESNDLFNLRLCCKTFAEEVNIRNIQKKANEEALYYIVNLLDDALLPIHLSLIIVTDNDINTSYSLLYSKVYFPITIRTPTIIRNLMIKFKDIVQDLEKITTDESCKVCVKIGYSYMDIERKAETLRLLQSFSFLDDFDFVFDYWSLIIEDIENTNVLTVTKYAELRKELVVRYLLNVGKDGDVLTPVQIVNEICLS